MEDPSFERLCCRRVVIRRFAPGDAEVFASYRSDPAVARYQEWECPYAISEARRFIASLDDLPPGRPGSWFQFAVSLASSGDLLGDVALGTSETDPGKAELGFTFSAVSQGQGYASEAVGAVVAYAFGQLAMDRLDARTDARNSPAHRLLARLGFRRQAVRQAATWFKGELVTDLLYTRLASEVAAG